MARQSGKKSPLIDDKKVAENKAKMIAMLRDGETVDGAAKRLDYSPRILYGWRRHDEQFAADWEAAMMESMPLRRERLREKSRRVAPLSQQTDLPGINALYGNKKDDPNFRNAVLVELSRGSSKYKAARAGGISYGTLLRWMDDDPKFAELARVAIEAGNDLMEDEARRRAVEGVEKPVYQGGELVGYVQEYSDSLMQFMLKTRRYNGPSEINVNNKHSGEIQHRHSIDITKLNDEELAIFERLIAKAQVMITLDDDEYEEAEPAE